MSSVFCKYKPLTFFLVIIMFSCEREFPVSDFNETDKLVVNCFISSDSTLDLKLTRTRSPYSSGNTFIDYDKCTIDLIDSGNRNIEFVRSGNTNKFDLKEKLTTGQKIKIFVRYPDLESVSSETILPELIKKVTYYGNVKVNEENEQVLSNRFVIDPGNNKYMIFRHIVNKKVITLAGDTITYSDTSWINNISENIMSVLPGNAVNTVLFAKLEANTENYVEFDSYDGFIKESNLIEGYSSFELLTCSEEYFKYMNTLQQYNWNRGEEDNYIILPVNIFSNIKDGYGIFAGFTMNTLKIKFK